MPHPGIRSGQLIDRLVSDHTCFTGIQTGELAIQIHECFMNLVAVVRGHE